ncbi:MAG: nicotinate-nucleotide adenylyltransferase [Alphaproteobacteria bacterium]|nr:nicotinate-nucleotide adenylyltransferase [Alphaproteobacteria bacterium SS10]
MWRGLRVGLLGGSFNPAHDGHRHISLLALKQLRLDQVWWLVSPQNPLKSSKGMAPLVERIESAQSVACHPRILVTAIEQDLSTRYTADTLPALRKAFPATGFTWLMGADNLSQIRHWQHWNRIFETMPVAVLARAPYSLRARSSMAAIRYQRHRLPHGRASRLHIGGPPRWVYLPIPLHGASATAIRAAR